MDTLSVLIGGMIALIAVVVGAGVIMIFHHIELHSRLTENRERDAVIIRPSSPPRHVDRPETTYTSYNGVGSGQQQATGAVPSRITPADTIPQPSPANTPSEANIRVPVDVTFADRAASTQRGGN